MKKLTKIRLINWHYFFNETINVNDNILLTGNNGTGKSTILDAITYVITAGDTKFNQAANEYGGRDIKSYVKCKVSRAGQEYLRPGDVSGHIALEFFDDIRNSFFTVGVVIDAFGDLLPAESLFYQVFEPLSDSFFVSDDGVILGTRDFRKKNTNIECFNTKTEAKKQFRATFGGLSDDFFRLIHRALAFKPIKDVKQFIYDHLLEEKEIDVENIKDSIRAYKELEGTLNVIKSKISALKEIEDFYKDVKELQDSKNYYNYILQLFEGKAIELDIAEYKNKGNQLVQSLDTKNAKIKTANSEINLLNERSRELYTLLKNDSEFVKNEYIDNQILKTSSEIQELTNLERQYLEKTTQLKDIVKNARKISDTPALKKLANVSLNNVPDENIESTKLTLVDIESQLEREYEKLISTRSDYNQERSAILREINEISQTLKGLENRSLKYNPTVLALKSEIEAGLKQMFNQDISCHILAELLEITDPKWADTIEVYLNQTRFNLIVEPRYYDAALQIYNRIKNVRHIYNVGLVNTKKITEFNSCKPNSMAAIITSENIDAKRYINFCVGNLILVDDVTELDQYREAITIDGMLYKGFITRALNFNAVERPFIGRDAFDKQLSHWSGEALKKKEEFQKVSQTLEAYNAIIKAYDALEIKEIIRGIDCGARLGAAQVQLNALKEQKKNASKMSASDVRREYDKVAAELVRYNELKDKLNTEAGSIEAEIATNEAAITQLTSRLEMINKDLEVIKLANIAIEQEATKEISECLEMSRDVKRHQVEYAKKVAEQDTNIGNLSNRINTLQFKYTQAFNCPYGVGLTEINSYLDELDKLEKSEIVTYEQKVRSAREDAELLFREDFLSKLRNYIMSAEDEISKVNDTLRDIRFGEDSYEFVFPKSKEFSVFYDMVTQDITDTQSGLFSYDFEMKYNEQLEELFASLAQDELNSNGALSRFTDYRTYMDYDIKITNHVTNSETYYSQVFKEKSGGETQVPFYVAIIASCVRCYQKGNKGFSDSIGLVMFDEVFDKMDDKRMKSMMGFINSMPLQILIACPSQRLNALAPYTETILVTLRDGDKAQIANVVSKDGFR